MYFGEILKTSFRIGFVGFGELKLLLCVDCDLGLLLSADTLSGLENV